MWRTIRITNGEELGFTNAEYRKMISVDGTERYTYWLGTRGASQGENTYSCYCQTIDSGRLNIALVQTYPGSITNLERRALRPFVIIPKDAVTWEKTEDGNIKISY